MLIIMWIEQVCSIVKLINATRGEQNKKIPIVEFSYQIFKHQKNLNSILEKY